MAVAEASLSTVNDSMSLGLMEASELALPPMVLLSIGNPSITMSGSLDALSDDPPRMRMVAPLPGAPLLVVTETPATFPTSGSWRGGSPPWSYPRTPTPRHSPYGHSLH